MDELDSISSFSRKRIEGLSKPELEGLRLAADGLTVDEIAKRRFRSSSTINTQLRSAYNKLGASNAAQAVALAFRQGLLR